MTKTFNKGIHEFHADKPLTVVPSIEQEYLDGSTRMYRMTDGKVYLADVYDRTLKAPPKGKVRRAYEVVLERRRSR